MKKELLAPAGDFETLLQAIHNGADAVYLGGRRFGARKFATNFSDDELIDAIKYAHLYGVKVYVTANTMIYEDEVNDFLEYITFLYKNNVDAVIMQDIGMIKLVRECLPDLDIHVSTQAHTHNIEQIHLLEKLGVTRVVLAREMSIDEINKIDTNLEIEAFIHGALCVSYSGQCLFSSMLLNRSGNRGECAGICRLPFKLFEDDHIIKTDGEYLLSTKELNTMDHIRELLDSNITSFKIEGRMKGATTIGFITRLYRNLIDHYLKGEEIKITEEEHKRLLVLFNREYTSGYLFNNKDIMNIKSPNHIGIKIGKVIDVNNRKIKIKLDDNLNQGDGIRFIKSRLGMNANFIYDSRDNLLSGAKSGEVIYLDNKIGLDKDDIVYKTVDSKLLKELESYDEKKIPVDINVTTSNDYFVLEISDGINKVVKRSNIIEKATGSGTSNERIIEQLKKLGNTPFIIRNISVDIHENIFVPISKLNDLRRNVIDELIEVRRNKSNIGVINEIRDIDTLNDISSIKLSVLVKNADQLEAAISQNVDYIYTDDTDLYNLYKNKYNMYLKIPRVINNYVDYSNERLLIGETGSINKYSKNNELVGDYYLNVSNSKSVDYFRKLGLSRITLSVENTIDGIRNIIRKTGNRNIEIIIYSKIEVMIMKYLPLQKLVNEIKNSNYYLKDRNGEKYLLKEKDNLTSIYYYKNTVIDDSMIFELKNMNILNYRIELLDESYSDTVNLIKKYKSLLFND